MDQAYSHHKTTTFIIMTAIWFALYAAVHILYAPSGKQSPKSILDTKNRIVSIVHGLGSFFMAVKVFLYEDFKYLPIYSQLTQLWVWELHSFVLNFLLRLWFHCLSLFQTCRCWACSPPQSLCPRIWFSHFARLWGHWCFRWLGCCRSF